MIWNKREFNQFDNISLSDCHISKIQKMENNIVIDFSEYGFFVRDSKNNRFYRTDGAQIIIEDCDIDSVSIKEIRIHKLSGDTYFETMYDVQIEDFIKNINEGMWKLEIVEEYPLKGKGYYIIWVNEGENCFWCHIKLRYKNLIYMWNKIKYNCPL